MIDRPLPFTEALQFVARKVPQGEPWSSAEWALEHPSVRVKAFFSAHVEDARFLQRAQGMIDDYLTRATEEVTGPDGVTRTALKTGGRADFVKRMKEFMVAEGMARPEEFAGVNRNHLTDIRSSGRLQLIFDTNVRQARGYGQWRQGMSPAVRRAFPAARFVRERRVGEARIRHAVHEGDVRLKTDFDYWSRYQNDPLIGGFGVPWPPYGFRSGMGQQDVPAAEAKRLGLMPADVVLPEPAGVPRLPLRIPRDLPAPASVPAVIPRSPGSSDGPDDLLPPAPPPAPPRPIVAAADLPGLNDGLQASTSGLDGGLTQRLLNALNRGPSMEGTPLEDSPAEWFRNRFSWLGPIIAFLGLTADTARDERNRLFELEEKVEDGTATPEEISQWEEASGRSVS